MSKSFSIICAVFSMLFFAGSVLRFFQSGALYFEGMSIALFLIGWAIYLWGLKPTPMIMLGVDMKDLLEESDER